MASKKGGRPRKHGNAESQRESRAAANRRHYEKKKIVSATQTASLQIVHDSRSLLNRSEIQGLSQLTNVQQGVQAEGLDVPIDNSVLVNEDLEVAEYFMFP